MKFKPWGLYIYHHRSPNLFCKSYSHAPEVEDISNNHSANNRFFNPQSYINIPNKQHGVVVVFKSAMD